MTITASGSILDVNGIVSQLMAIEQQPLKKLDSIEAGYQARLSAYGTLKSGLSALREATATLTSVAGVQSTKASPSDISLFVASANTTAIPGKYRMDITRLAQEQNLAADGQLDTTSAIGSGALNFDFGTIADGALDTAAGKYAGASFTGNGTGTRTVTIDSARTSLGDIRDAINAAAIGVTASIINDGSATPYRLVLTSTSGAANSIRISVAGDQALANLLAHDPADDAGQRLAETIAAQDSAFKVNGIAATKSSNTVTDVIHGVTLNLLKETTSAATLTVTRDTSSINGAVDAFVKAYNDVAKPLKDLSTYNIATRQTPVLEGDSALLAIQNQVRNIIAARPAGMSGSFRALSQIGVAFQKDGSLAVDSAKLQNAINHNAADVAAIVAHTGGRLTSLLDAQLGSNGALTAKTDGINLGLKSLTARRTRLSSRLADIEQRYRSQYAALDAVLGSMKFTSDALAQQLAGLPGAFSKTA
ncbi:MAG: flagellar filament capping protein FliD [Sterolibacterium sp.]